MWFFTSGGLRYSTIPIIVAALAAKAAMFPAFSLSLSLLILDLVPGMDKCNVSAICFTDLPDMISCRVATS